ncbi:polysaccharide biosynthesis tyrosine autokinase [Nodosilinea sp. LEGE 07088]|uniref:GumC family protein n=1 Tax=Nodosilinea sp. LEGE 07088 TaxID=2777968 RepID=UPI00187FCC0D|nr:tyrosine-protein kinase domain-containing protein [Nodosilinea sp. LEGE 07088]MBE9139576.1 polysaccharide biosynthesis tyrosine autokinase [Nodosilinea sp. LEGE 07088]
MVSFMISDSSQFIPKPQNDDDAEGGLQLGRVFSALRRHALLIAGITTLTASAAVLKAVVDNPSYQGDFELLTSPVTVESTIVSAAAEGQQDPAALSELSLNATKLKVLLSPRVIDPVVERLQAQFPGTTYDEIYGNLVLAISPEAEDVLIVSYGSPDKEKTMAVLEYLSEAYLDFGLEDRQRDLLRGIAFVDEQLPTLQQRVEIAESRLESLRQSSNLVDPVSQGAQLTQQIGGFTQQALALQVEIREREKSYQDLQGELARSRDLAASPTLAADPNYQNLLTKLVEVDSQLSAQSALYLNESPEIAVIEDQRENLLPVLRREGERVQRQLANTIGELRVREQGIRNTINSLNQQLETLATTSRQYNDIQREIQFATDNLNQFISKRETLRLEAAQRQSPWELLAPIDEPYASASSAKRSLVLGTVLGLLLGSGVALFRDRFSGKIYSIEELKAATGLPLLGTVPLDPLMESDSTWLQQLRQMAESQTLTNFSQEDWAQLMNVPFFESFRSLYTTIKLSNPDRPYTTMAVSSVSPNAGKTTVSFYLALAAAMMGERVLVVDTDLRRPSLHRYGQVDGDRGLTNLLGDGFNVDKLAQPFSFEPNLWVLPAGVLPSDPTRIISSDAMERFVQRARQEFDLVIYDTPPMLGFADAYLMSAQTDGLLLVANLEGLKRAELDNILEQLRLTTSSVIGLVVNAVKGENVLPYGYYTNYEATPAGAKGLSGFIGKTPLGNKLPAILGTKDRH